MGADPLQTDTVEHALCGSAKHGHLGEREGEEASCIIPALIIHPLYYAHATLYAHIFPQLLPLPISWTESPV